jgi:hypothetical protein
LGLQASPSQQVGLPLPQLQTPTTTGTLALDVREQLLDEKETPLESPSQPHSSPTTKHLLPPDPHPPSPVPDPLPTATANARAASTPRSGRTHVVDEHAPPDTTCAVCTQGVCMTPGAGSHTCQAYGIKVHGPMMGCSVQSPDGVDIHVISTPCRDIDAAAATPCRCCCSYSFESAYDNRCNGVATPADFPGLTSAWYATRLALDPGHASTVGRACMTHPLPAALQCPMHTASMKTCSACLAPKLLGLHPLLHRKQRTLRL